MPARTVEYMKEKREQIVSATIDCIGRLGLAQASLSEICTAAKISRGAFYIHFASKDELLEAIVQRLGEESSAALSFDSVESFRKSLESQLKFMLAPARISQRQVELDLMIASRVSERLHFEFSKAVNRRFERLREGVQKLADAGLCNVGVDATVAAHVIDSFLIGSVKGGMTVQPVTASLKSLRFILAAILRTHPAPGR